MYTLVTVSFYNVYNFSEFQCKIIFYRSSGSKNDDKNPIVVKELETLLKSKNVYVIDVREKHEINKSGKIPTSINIPLDDLKEALNENSEDFQKKYGRKKPDKNDNIVMYCRRGPRSIKARKEAVRHGYKKLCETFGRGLDSMV
uniref:Rhodanese domain-containing protein n=1 Tax=Clastoptera arizonana TaxID=38151 RepID=A0A1B6D4J2_9HEMI